MKHRKNDLTACLPFPEPVLDFAGPASRTRPRALRRASRQTGGHVDRRSGGSRTAGRRPLALHRMDLGSLLERSEVPVRAVSGREGRADMTWTRRAASRGDSSPRLAPRTDRGSSLPVETPSARAVRQSEACAFYLDLIGAATAMTLVVLAAILV